jgi:hypothetical protein
MKLPAELPIVTASAKLQDGLRRPFDKTFLGHSAMGSHGQTVFAKSTACQVPVKVRGILDNLFLRT